jgi:hypothetical protein
MKPELYEQVAVTLDIPEEGLKRGDVATVVQYLEHPQGGEEGAILEVFNAVGESIGIVTVPVSAIESLNEHQMPSVRPLEKTG